MTPCSCAMLPCALSTSSSPVCTVLNQPCAIVCQSRTSPQACTTCFHAPEVGHHQHHAPMSSSLKSPPSSALTDIHVDPSDSPVRPSRNYLTATMLHPASCPLRTIVHCLNALCMHDPAQRASGSQISFANPHHHMIIPSQLA